MRILLLLYLSLVFYGQLVSQPSVGTEGIDLIGMMKDDIRKGRKRTLRDIGSLLNHPQHSKQARSLLQKSTFFTPEEFNISTCKQADFIDFYYQHESQLQYSELLNAFYLTPLESRKTEFKIRSIKSVAKKKGGFTPNRQLFLEIDTYLNESDYQSVSEVLEDLVNREDNEVTEMLFQLLQDGRLLEAPAVIQKDIYAQILNRLENYPEIEVVEIMLAMLEGSIIDEDMATPLLTNITNVSPELGTEYETVGEYYQFLVDSLETLYDIRLYGYDRIFNFRLNFFQFPVDYYGKIIGLSDNYPWIKHNALIDLKRTQHPRAFFYIVTDLYRNRKESLGIPPNYYFSLIRSQINIEVGVKEENGKITFQPDIEDETAMLNYLIYWASRYNDYEWDEDRNIFTNKLETLAKTQNYERLFRRLNSRNDSVAMQSFILLAEGDPVEIKSLAKKYRQLLRHHNPLLPSLKYQYLEQMAWLTDYCRKNKLSFKPDRKLRKQLDRLVKAETPEDRYALENQIIRQLTLKDVTALEYWACLHENNNPATFSVGRILDWFYSKNWDKILQNPAQLRLYLKKSYLFSNIGVIGVCNSYLNKFNLVDTQTQLKLHELGKSEVDEDILNQMALLMAEAPEEEYISLSLIEFMEDPLYFNRRDIRILPEPNVSELEQIISIIQKESDSDVIKQLFSYIRLHANIDFVPKLFRLIDDERVVTQRSNLTVSVADNIIPIIENVYQYSYPIEDHTHPFATEKWRAKWEKDQANYQHWADHFFTQKLDSLQYYETLKIEQVNQIVESEYFKSTHKPALLKALKKIKPSKHIRRLHVDPKLSLEEDLVYFQDFFFNYKELDDIPKLFEIDDTDAGLMLVFLREKSKDFSFTEKGSFYNNILRSPWLSRYLDSGKAAPEETKNIYDALESYLNDSDFLSEYEEQITLLHLAKIDFIGKNLEDKLQAVLGLNIDPSSKAKILEDIIATISYEEISTVAKYFDAMNTILRDKSYDFLHRDFGLPIFTINSLKEQEQLIRHHQNLNEFDFYCHYLKKFGLSIWDSRNQLDFEKIYDILQYDIVSPFVGNAGGKRDEYSYGIIKVLELHFNTRLGFHEKLNESQTFYSFSSSKRAETWLDYLNEKKLINRSTSVPPSFNKKIQEDLQ